MSRYLLPVVSVLLAVALIAAAAHELSAHVLAFDWTAAR